MRGYVVQVKDNEPTAHGLGQSNHPEFVPLTFAKTNEGAVNWVKDNITNPDMLVRIIPAIMIPDEKRPGQWEIGTAH